VACGTDEADLVGAVEDEGFATNDLVGLEILELAVRVKVGRAPEARGEILGCDENRPLDGFRDGGLWAAEEHGEVGRHGLAGQVKIREYRGAVVGVPALRDVVVGDVTLQGGQAGAPADVGVAENFVRVERPAEELIRIFEVIGVGTDGREGVEEKQRSDGDSPRAGTADERPGPCGDEHDEKGIDGKDVAQAEVELRAHGEAEVYGGGEKQEQ